MTANLDRTMEQASVALAAMDYLTCESLCLSALATARDEKDWAYYGRILMPLQECRRQRRMIAADGMTRLSSGSLGDPLDWIDQHQAGCLVLTRPHTADEATAANRVARKRGRYIEVLWADCDQNDDTWQFRTFQGPAIVVERPAPASEWRDQDLPAQRIELLRAGSLSTTTNVSVAAKPMVKPMLTPADWFIDVSEQIGDALLADVVSPEGSIERVEALEHCLEAVSDHEILHQRLWDAVRQRQLR